MKLRTSKIFALLMGGKRSLMAKTRQQLDNELRTAMIANLTNVLAEQGEEVLRVSSTEIAIPTTDSEGGDTYVIIEIRVPKGAKIDGGYAGYNGHELAVEYAEDVARKEKEKAEAAKNKKAKAKKSPKEEKEGEGE